MAGANPRTASLPVRALAVAVAAIATIGPAVADSRSDVESFVGFMRERAIQPFCFGDPCPSTTITLATFNFNASAPRRADRDRLRNFVEALSDPRVQRLRQTFRVECFADASGDAGYNRWLSQQRYEAIACALASIDAAAAARVSGGGAGIPHSRRGPPADSRRCDLSVVAGFSPVR